MRKEWNNAPSLPEQVFHEVEATLTHSNELADNFFDSLLLTYPESGYLIGMKAYFLCLENKIDSAKQFIANEISLKNTLLKNTYVCLAMAMISEYQGDRSSSMKYFKNGLEFDTNGTNKWIRLECFYAFQDSNLSVAQSNLESALQIDPNFTTAFIESMHLLIAEDQFPEAISKITAFSATETNEKLCYLLGFCHLQLQTYQEAAHWFNKSLSLESNVDALVGMGYLSQFAFNQVALALDFYKEAYSLEPENATVNKRLGVYYMDKEEYLLAKGYLEKAIQVLPSQEDYLLLVYVQVVLKEFELALRLNSECTSIFGWVRDNEFWSILITSLQGNVDKAQHLLNEYYEEYSIEDVAWLKSELKAWGVDVVKK